MKIKNCVFTALTVSLLGGAAVSLAKGTPEKKTEAAKRDPAASRKKISDACLEASAFEAARSVVQMEIQSSLKRSFQNYVSRLKSDWGQDRVTTEAARDWQIVPFDSYYYQDVTGIDGDEETFAREDQCSFVAIIESTVLYNSGFLTQPYMVHVKLERNNSSNSTDKTWKVGEGSPNRAVFRLYPNNNPRG